MTYDYYRSLIGEYLNLGSSEEKLLAEIGYPENIDLSPDELIRAVSIIGAAAENDIKKLVELSGLSMRATATKFAIPYRTLQDWCSGNRPATPYIVMLIGYALIGDKQ
jgi:hypothetical protein